MDLLSNERPQPSPRNNPLLRFPNGQATFFIQTIGKAEFLLVFILELKIFSGQQNESIKLKNESIKKKHDHGFLCYANLERFREAVRFFRMAWLPRSCVLLDRKSVV